MKYRLFALALALAALSNSAAADEPPSWKDFSVKSENAQYAASVSAYGRKPKSSPWENRYRIQVRTAGAHGRPRVIWERPYHYDGYADGMLSNDGAYFVYVDFWYRHATPAVRIYSKRTSCSLTGEQLGMKESALEKTVSHRLWLNGKPTFVELRGEPVAIMVPTVQGQKRIELARDPVVNGVALHCARDTAD